MTGEDEQSQSNDDFQGGPGAPMPLSQLEVCLDLWRAQNELTMMQGINGLTARDIKLFVDAGYNTVESVAYT
jgi:DNA repair protein RAD51